MVVVAAVVVVTAQPEVRARRPAIAAAGSIVFRRATALTAHFRANARAPRAPDSVPPLLSMEPAVRAEARAAMACMDVVWDSPARTTCATAVAKNRRQR